ncbi:MULTISPECIES: hypothetical protein [Pseudomonas]|uniref:CS1 type fimbrial major subunit n=2 Tax=Pseudomonas TaxID=286 RepID=A0A2R7UDR3_PSEDL|nr:MULTISPECIES: hypothetical protein [Pseudomonas]MRF43377.1 hypothetical protein [Escherichia coli]MBF8648088.1 hypothetical protein [Pseudomonas pudica]MBF8709547.1 hypothetical protein [Pseudomonas putida]MBF8762370.1 hypothetical protein [Pseudomonas pudica]MDZ5109883.1 hypothetical protein [Pseudomonas putida]
MNIRVLLASALTVASSYAIALEPKHLDIAVNAVVAAPAFEYKPIGEWGNSPVKLQFKKDSQHFPPVKHTAFLKSPNGAVTVKYAGKTPEFLDDNGKSVGLRYIMSINGKKLPDDGSSVQVLPAAEAAVGKEVDFYFRPMTLINWVARPGTYTAQVELVFETEPPL